MAITIDGSTGVQLDDNDKQEFGNSADLKIFHDGSNSYIKDAGTGQLDISSDKVWISGSNNESMADFTENGAVQLYYNNSKKFQTESYGNQAFGEFFIGDGNGTDASNHIRLGNGADLKIYHDGSNSYIENATGVISSWSVGNHEFKSSNGNTRAVFKNGGECELYHNNSKKFETYSNGVTVTGNLSSNYNGSSQYGLTPNDSQTSGTHIQFQRQGYNNGNITHDTNNSAYNTSGSDRTLKKNFEDWTDSYWTAFKNLSPQKFHFLTDADSDPKCRGYIAQDLVATFPEAYPKEIISDKYMFNPSGMVPYLMKTLKEALTEIDTLKTKVAALEAA